MLTESVVIIVAGVRRRGKQLGKHGGAVCKCECVCSMADQYWEPAMIIARARCLQGRMIAYPEAEDTGGSEIIDNFPRSSRKLLGQGRMIAYVSIDKPNWCNLAHLWPALEGGMKCVIAYLAASPRPKLRYVQRRTH